MGRFKKDKNFAGNSRGFGKGRDSGKKEFDMDNFKRGGRSSRDNGPHEVICARCGITTDVPFKPTTNKPVYCRDCFKRADTADERRSSSFTKRGSSDRSFQPQRDSRPSDDGLAAINKKLDKIMEALEIDDE